MFTLKHSLEIEAPPERVWEILMDFDRYPEWNPYILSFRTSGAIGSRFDLCIVQPNWKKPMNLRPILADLDPAERELRWRYSVGMRGLFDTDHSLCVIARGESACRVLHSERFTGVFAFLFPAAARKAKRSTFQLMNKALRKRAES